MIGISLTLLTMFLAYALSAGALPALQLQRARSTDRAQPDLGTEPQE